MKQPAVYIITNKRNGTLYIGVTSNIMKRIWEHKNKIYDGFSKKYDLNLCVYCEYYDFMEDALYREKMLKKWKRSWKIKLIEDVNPYWQDLYLEWTGCLPPQA